MKKLGVLLLVPTLACAHHVSSNIDIVPLSSMNFPPKMEKEIKSYNLEIKKNGFFEKDDAYTKKLMMMRYNKISIAKSPEPGSDELKKSLAEIKTNFTFKSVLPNTIAYAGIGMVSHDGYSGIKQFFDGKEAGMCTLSVFNISNVKDHIKLNVEGLTYEINDKPTRITVEGSVNSGFMYSIRWYDKIFVREIECANNDMNSFIKAKIIEYAKKVDET